MNRNKIKEKQIMEIEKSLDGTKTCKYRFVFENEEQLKNNLSKIKELHRHVIETRKEVEQLNSELEKTGELSKSLSFDD